jgi:hypothetical protein
MRIVNPQSPHKTMEVCDDCGWPPALDGRCLCFQPELRGEDGCFPDYSEHILNVRRRFGPPIIAEHN